MSPLLITAAAFVAVFALVLGVALLFRDKSDSKVEQRLDLLTNTHAATSLLSKESLLKQSSVLAQPLDIGAF